MTPTPSASDRIYRGRKGGRHGGQRIEGNPAVSRYDPLCPDHSKHEPNLCPPRKPGEETRTIWPLPPKPIDPTAHWKRKPKP